MSRLEEQVRESLQALGDEGALLYAAATTGPGETVFAANERGSSPGQA